MKNSFSSRAHAVYLILIISFGAASVLLCTVLNTPQLWSASALLFWSVGMIYSLADIKERFALFSFNIGFFLFILGGYTVSYIENGNFSYFSNSYFQNTPEAIVHACRSAMISIFAVNAFYAVFSQVRKSRKKNSRISTKAPPRIPRAMRIFIVSVLTVSFICKSAAAIESITLVNRVTYYQSVNYLSSLPSIVIHLASLYYIFLFLYLAILPKKRYTLLAITGTVMIELLLLFAGERGEPISIFFTVIFYIFYRQRKGIRDILISKKMIAAVIILLPFIFYGLQALSFTRNAQSYDVSLGEGITDFIEVQGGSIKIISNSYDLCDRILTLGGNDFVLGEIRNYLKNNVFTRLLLGKSLSLRTVDDAISGDNFLRTYGYAYSPVTYLSGVGSGSSYIAEIYHDGGYFLLFSANIFYAFMLTLIDSAEKRSFVTAAISMNVFRYIPLLPRGMALDFLTNTFAFQNIIIFLFLSLWLRYAADSQNCIHNGREKRLLQESNE